MGFALEMKKGHSEQERGTRNKVNAKNCKFFRENFWGLWTLIIKFSSDLGLTKELRDLQIKPVLKLPPATYF
jgi:hypothetical protein